MKLVFTFACVLCLIGRAWAAEYSVSPGEPVAAILEKLRPGDTLRLEPGVYTEQLLVSGVRGSEEAPIRIAGTEGAVIEPRERDGILFFGGGGSSHIIVEGLRIQSADRAGIVLNNASYVTIRDCVISGCGKWGVQTIQSSHIVVDSCDISGSREQHGIYFSSTDYPRVIGCLIHHNAACGIHMNGAVDEGGDGMIEQPVVEKNRIFANGKEGGAAINVDGATGAILYRNALHGNFSGGIAVFVQDGAGPGKDHRLVQNTIVFEKGEGRFGIQLRDGVKGAVIERNVVVCGSGPALETDLGSATSLSSDWNLLFSLRSRRCVRVGTRDCSLLQWKRLHGQDRHSVCRLPLFTNAAEGDYSLKEGSSGSELNAGAF